MKINIITAFPQLFEQFLNTYPLSKAKELNLIEVDLINLRDFPINNYGSIDNKPFGGGAGMTLSPISLKKALNQCGITKDTKVIVLDPSGYTYKQQTAKKLAKINHIVIICGRYEGIDQRIIDLYATDTISMGDYIISGGETASMAILESITRLLPGVLSEEATLNESFNNYKIEAPQYTKPREFEGLKVPEVLISGDHKRIEDWKLNNPKQPKKSI
jgi:tRNA (guanine37-N1)-methyltransferase